MGLDSQSKDPRLAGVLNRGKLVVIMRILSLVREENELAKRTRSLWSAFIEWHKIRGFRKHMLSLWLQKGMIWVSEQRSVDQANTIQRNSWMTEIEIEELERKVIGSDSVIVEEARSVEVLPNQVGEDVRNVFAGNGSRRAG